VVSGRARLTVCAAIATLAAACSLLPLVTPAVWLLMATLLVAVQSAVGAVTRRIPLARPLTVAAQAVVSLLLMTLFFVRADALGGLLPGPGAFEGFGALLAQGGQDVTRYTTPAPVSPGIRLMLVGGVLVIALLVDAIAVTYRSAAPAGLPLLALYSVAAGLSDGGTRWLWFLCAAAGYLLLLLSEGRDRLSGWGRLFVSGRDASGRGASAGAGTARAPVRTGRRIGVVTLGIALMVPTALPTLDGGLIGTLGTAGSGISGDGNTITAVNPLVALQDSLNQPDNRTVLSYRTTAADTQGMYLRIVALDEFDGSSWKPSRRRIVQVPDPLPPPPGLSPAVHTEKIRTTITAADWYAQNWLPMPYPASRVQVDGRWRFEPEGRTLVGDRGQTTRGVHYSVESLRVEPTARQLAEAPIPDPKLVKEYTKVPPSLPAVVHQKALTVTRGAHNDYERAVKLQDWFAVDGGFTYDTHVKAGTGTSAIARFLKDKEGFCVHFAFAMAAMARTLHIPARVAVGFTPGTQSRSGVMKVGLQDAHAWPELYFAGVGWTRFEPTPTRGSTPSYAMPDVTGTGGDDPLTAAPKGQPSSRPSAGAAPATDCPVEVKRLDPTCGAKGDPQSAHRTGSPPPLGAVVVLILVAALLVLVPLLPWLWRVRARRRRLRPGAGTIAVWEELLDSGWDHGVLPDPSQTPRRVAARLTEAGAFDAQAQAAAHRLALAVERELYAPAPQQADGLTADVRRVRAALRASASRGARLRATLWPRSAARVLWSAAAWRRAVADRWRTRLSRPATPRRGADHPAR
jgi:transglutaminase-like putative cysteine protease